LSIILKLSYNHNIKNFTSIFYNAMQLSQIEFLTENLDGINTTLLWENYFTSIITVTVHTLF